MRSTSRLLGFAVVSLGLVLARPSAAGSAETDACIASSDAGQQHRDEGKLRAALSDFRACSRDACPALVRSDCLRWLSDAELRLPRIIVRAKDARGNEVFDVAITLDGDKLVDRLDGRLIPVDAGEHMLQFTRSSDGAVVQRMTTLREGEKDRTIDVVFPAPSPSPDAKPTASSSTHRSLVLPLALGGVAVLGGAAFAILASSARSDVDDLRATCAPDCPTSDVSAARTKLIAANVSLGVGVVALTAAVVVYVLGDSGSATSGRAPASTNALRDAALRGAFVF